MSLSPQWLDELRNRISLSGLIGRSVRVIKAGREFKACCPFHNEKTPSFTINDDKGFYHCFGCGAHGDAIRWMTDHQGLPFIDAVKELAAQAGMDMPAPDPRAAARAEAQKTLHDAMAAAQDVFRAALAGDGGREARAYLATRGFPADVVERFGFGFAPDSRGALAAALPGFAAAQLVEAGLLIAVDGREPYARFRGRLMLPIHDARGRVIAFGGRILTADKTDAPKYLNSPDTPLFDKGRTLFNLHRAAPVARPRERLIVVEGYMDVVALAAAGIAEAVAPLGTALTEDQLDRAWTLVACPTLCFDGDAAGQRAAHRAIVRALPRLRPGHSLAIVTLPEGQDPDDVVKRGGAAAIEALLEGAVPLIDAVWAMLRDAEPLGTPEAKAGLKARVIETTEAIAHPDIRALYRRELLERFGALAFPPRDAPRRDRPPAKTRDRRTTAPALPLADADRARLQQVGSTGRTLAPLLDAVLAGLVAAPRLIAVHAETLARLIPADAGAAQLLDVLLDHAGDGLESGALAAILDRRGLIVPPVKPYSRHLYAAIRVGEAEPIARAAALLVETAEVDAALDAANQAFAIDQTEENFAEQQRLRQRGLALLAKVRQMEGAGAAL